jgi:hypothetical protein
MSKDYLKILHMSIRAFFKDLAYVNSGVSQDLDSKVENESKDRVRIENENSQAYINIPESLQEMHTYVNSTVLTDVAHDGKTSIKPGSENRQKNQIQGQPDCQILSRTQQFQSPLQIQIRAQIELTSLFLV